MSPCLCRALLEEALQLERQLHIALLADKLSKQDEDKEQQQEEEEGQEKQAGTDADADAAAADSLAIPGVPGIMPGWLSMACLHIRLM